VSRITGIEIPEREVAEGGWSSSANGVFIVTANKLSTAAKRGLLAVWE
jgi:hypothetical protein